MKKRLILGIVYFFIVSILIIGCMDKQAKDLKIGDYIEFGKYNNVPILWRVINIDKEGNPMLFSDKIISLKAFDASGDYHKNKYKLDYDGDYQKHSEYIQWVNAQRVDYGSNYWKDSNIRQWLNSNERAGTIKWIQNPPSKENMFCNFSPYEKEKGFLADGNFTENERNIIKSIKHKSFLDEIDKNKKDGGEERLAVSLKEGAENSDIAYYQTIEDKVFLLSIKEIQDYVCKNKDILGKEYYIGKPTKEAVAHSTEKTEKLNPKYNWRTLSRCPNITGPGFVTIINEKGKFSCTEASFGGFGGVCPALFLNKSSSKFENGSGDKSDPYILKP